jgi:hypothetical protein
MLSNPTVWGRKESVMRGAKSKICLMLPFSAWSVQWAAVRAGTPPSSQSSFPKSRLLIEEAPTGSSQFRVGFFVPSPGDRIVLYAHSGGLWWLQPASSRPFTEIKPDLTWSSLIHLGDRYAALIVHASFTPVNKVQQLPVEGGTIRAIVEVPG